METLIRARRDVPFSDAVEIHLAERKEFGLYVAQPAIFKEALEGENTVPFLRLRMQEAQRLMDELWGCGLRPSEGTGSAGSLRATEKHLSDMQRIAFMLLERPNAPHEGPGGFSPGPLDAVVGPQTNG